jgi:hypothetical protein
MKSDEALLWSFTIVATLVLFMIVAGIGTWLGS